MALEHSALAKIAAIAAAPCFLRNARVGFDTHHGAAAACPPIEDALDLAPMEAEVMPKTNGTKTGLPSR